VTVSVSSFGNAKDQIRQAVDIVDLVSGSIDLRRQGRGFVGLCPWHNDSRPSLQVNQERQTWKCWVCDIGGDIFNFVMKREGCDFVEALRILADRAGIELEPQRQKRIEPGSPDDKNTLYQAAAWAEKQFHEFLLRGEAAGVAQKYIEDRGITPASVEKFRIGFSPDNWSWILDRARNTPYSAAVLEAIGLLGRSQSSGKLYDRFKGRVIFPIRDTQGRTIAFGGRILPQFAAENSAKYINSPETRLFSKSDQLYALDIARHNITQSREITVVEGYTDVVMCHQHGVGDVVAVLGTALNERHLPVLRRFADTVYLILDGDEAGQRRTNQILELFVAAQMDLRILTLPEEFDPDEFLQEHGGEAFKELRRGAVDALEHKIRTSTRGIDLARDTHRANAALEDILHTIAHSMPPGSIDATSLRAHQLLARVARDFRIDESVARARFDQLRRASSAKSNSSSVASSEQDDLSIDYSFQTLDPNEAELLELLALHPELAPTALQEIGLDDLLAPAAQRLFETYRNLEEAGESLDFNTVLAEVEDSRLKTLLVRIDERATLKEAKATFDPPTRLRAVIRNFHKRHEERQRREIEAALELQQFNTEEELDVLKQMIEAKRRQQGIIAPTEG
jgi:DNA primase